MSFEFDELGHSFDRVIETLKGRLARIEYADEREKLASKAGLERDLANARSTMAKMKELSMKNPGSEMSSRVRQYSYDLQQVERDIGRVIHIGSSSAPQFSAPKTQEGWQEAERGQRTQLLLGNQKIDSTGRTMQESRAIGQESENIGHAALTELQRQRGQLEGAADDLDTMDDDVTQAASRLASIGRKAIYNKLILWFVVVMLCLGIFAVIFWKWIWPLIKNSSPQPAPAPHPQPAHPVPVPIPVHVPVVVPTPVHAPGTI